MAVRTHSAASIAARFAHLVGLQRRSSDDSLRRRAGARKAKPVARSRSDAPVADLEEDPRAEMEGDGPLAAARRRERARCNAILRAGMEAGELALAASLAFETTESARFAIGFISSRVQAPKRDTAASWRRAFRLAAADRSADADDRNNSGWNEAFQRARESQG